MKDEPGRGDADCPVSSDEGQTNVSAALVELNSTSARKVASSSDSELPLKDNSTDILPRSHRAVDVLRQSPVVEMHRSSSGRNLRLKHLSLADGALLSAPNALTPRAPSGRRPESRQRLYSADSSNNHGSSNNESLLQRSSSFSISAHVLKDLERVRSSTDPEGLAELCERPEQNRRRAEEDDLQQREDSSDESEEIHWDTQDDIGSRLDNIQMEEKAVSNFGLWGKAAKNKRLPDAIIFSGSNVEESKPSYSRSSSASLSSEVQPMDITPNYNQPSHVPTASEMVSRLHITHPHLAALSVLDMPKSMSLTRSTSPRIGRPGFSSLPDTSLRRAAAPTNNQQMEAETESEVNSVEIINPITQWRRGELIGEGTFGKVYKGLNIATGGLFALKKIEIHTSPNADQVTQMQKLGEEISLMNNLSHKHIVRYKGSHRSANHFYIFMEYVPGGSIASMLKQFDAFSEDLIRIFTRQIVQGVVYLHQMGIVHRDIKGANVLVNEQGVSKLADFGCSKQIPQMLTTSLEESLRSIRGSIPWMAPEVVKQTGHDYKADIWSIGATVIEMATAKHPWPHCHNGLAAMYTIAMATAPPPLPINLSDEAREFLRRCFCIDPEERATALELSEHAFLAER
ncbi:hypothetical protein V7S43_015680 [Phytophthora oleae]|uniref:Protein kinase domain-containing protein n=1 Tax=Phytophthora oleae TaxID=2107226 RepID=A0ABD3F1Q9_9STRA